MLFIAIDIETTGQHYLGKDCLIAIGAAMGKKCSDGRFEVFRSDRWVVDLEKPTGQTWAQVWSERGYEARCFDEFWSKNLEVLEYLQACREKTNQDTVITRFNEFLGQVEKEGPYSIISDTLFFDTVWLDYHLRSCGFAGLSRKRDGTGWISGYELDSLRFGRTQAALGDWSALEEKCSALPWRFPSNSSPHDPEFDAIDIFQKFAQVEEIQPQTG